jgi:hypothetical protein
MEESPCFAFREPRCRLIISAGMLLLYGGCFIGMATLDLEQGFISRRHERENTQGTCSFLWGEHPMTSARFSHLDFNP